MADIDSDYSTWSTTESANPPAGSTAVGTGLDDNLRAIQAGVANLVSDLTSGAYGFASGTRMLFQQTAAPTGWTKESSATYNDAALRFQTGTVTTGGADAFSSHFGTSKSTASYTLTTTDIPSHTHTFTTGNNSVDHNHQVSSFAIAGASGSAVGVFSGTTVTSGISVNHTHSGTTNAAGSGSGHSHTLSAFNIKYIDTIIAAKD